MYIVTADSRQIINSEYPERFCICEKPDAALIVASYSDVRQPVTIGRYRDVDEAVSAMGDLLSAMAGGQKFFYMPTSLLYWEAATKKDARTKRRGGS